MLSATKSQETNNFYKDKPWFMLPKAKVSKNQTIGILGAGIAGCTAAYAFAKRGHKVILFEKNKFPAQEASGNLLAIFNPPNKNARTLKERLIFEGYLYFNNLLNELQYQQFAHFCGIFDFENFIKNVQGGWISLPKFCEALINRHNVIFVPNCEIKKINFASSWEIFSQEKKFNVNQLVITTGCATNQFAALDHIAFQKSVGVVSYIETSTELSKLCSILKKDIFLTPAYDGLHMASATYDLGQNLSDHQMQALALELNEKIKKNFQLTLNSQKMIYRAAIKTNTKDFLPVIGPVVDEADFRNQFSDLAHGNQTKKYNIPKYIPKLFVLMGLGSFGTLFAPLGAEIVAQMALGERILIWPQLLNAVNPQRFLVKTLMKKK